MRASFNGTVKVVGKDARLFNNDKGRSIMARIGVGAYGGYIWFTMWVGIHPNEDDTTVQAKLAEMTRGAEVAVFNATIGTTKRPNQDGEETDENTMRVGFRDTMVIGHGTPAPEEDESPFYCRRSCQ